MYMYMYASPITFDGDVDTCTQGSSQSKNERVGIMRMHVIPRTLNLPRVEYAILVPVRTPFSASPLLCETFRALNMPMSRYAGSYLIAQSRALRE